MRIGLIADTHGFLDPRVAPALAGVDRILHAGDIGSAAILEALAEIAPVTAVYGNNDPHLAHLGLPLRADIVLAGVCIHLVHRIVDAQPPGDATVVVFGHSHKPLVEDREGVLHVNPGAAGRVGFHHEITVGLLTVERGVCKRPDRVAGPASALRTRASWPLAV